MAWTVKWTNRAAGWSIDSRESFGNAQMAFNYLTSHGYTRNAAIGVIANLRAESYVNPGQWQIGYSYYGSGAGFGLGQWTPWTKVSNAFGSQDQSVMSDGDRQMNYLVTNKGQWGHGYINRNGYSSYYNTQSIYFNGMDDYAKSNASAEDLAIAWAIQWERPSARYANFSGRRSNAQYYSTHISGGEIPEEGTHYISIRVVGNGSASANYVYAKAGTEIILIHIEGTGAEFIGWTVESGGITIVNNRFIMPDNDVSIIANFTGESQPVVHTITIVNDSKLIEAWSDPTEAIAGTEIKLYYVNHGRDRFRRWKVIEPPEGLSITWNKNGYYTFTMPDADVIIEVEFYTVMLAMYMKPWYIQNTNQ